MLSRSVFASKLAYDDRTRKVVRWRIDEPRTHTRVIILEPGIVAFRGTHSVASLMRVAGSSIVPSRTVSIREDAFHVNTGMMDMFESVEAQLARAVQEYDDLVFCGHSLGGCLAILAASYYASTLTGLRARCHTFGTPKFGDEAMYAWRDKRCYQTADVVAAGDPFPHLWLTGDRKQLLCPELRESDLLVATSDKDHPLRAHSLTNYAVIARFLERMSCLEKN